MKYMNQFKSKAEWASAIRASILTNDKAVVRALTILYNRQTPDEQAIREDKYLNDRGFTKAHAQYLTAMAEWVLVKCRPMTERQLNAVRNMVVRYARQLMEAATNGEGNLLATA